MFTINKAPLTITADDKSKVYGQADPAFTASFAGFVFGETALVVNNLQLSRVSGEAVASYVITVAGTSPNYEITLVPVDYYHHQSASQDHRR